MIHTIALDEESDETLDLFGGLLDFDGFTPYEDSNDNFDLDIHLKMTFCQSHVSRKR